MGEAFLRKRAKGFEHQCDASMPSFTMPTIFTSQREVYERGFACSARDVGSVPIGQDVLLMAADGGVEIMYGNQSIGAVATLEDIEMISKAITTAGGFVPAVVRELCELTGELIVTVAAEVVDE